MSDALDVVATVMAGGTATGTLALALALATFKLSRGTTDQLAVLRRQADTATAALSAQVRPLLIDAPQSGEGDDEAPLYPGGERGERWKRGYAVVTFDAGRGFVSVPVRNVGPGPAHVLHAQLVVRGAELPPDIWASTKQYVPTGEVVRVSFVLGGDAHHAQAAFIDAARAFGEGVAAEVTHADVGGGQRTTTRFELARRITEDGWIVVRIDHRPAE